MITGVYSVRHIPTWLVGIDRGGVDLVGRLGEGQMRGLDLYLCWGNSGEVISGHHCVEYGLGPYVPFL